MKFATLGTLALTLTSLATADAQAFGKRKRGNTGCCQPVSTCSTCGYGSSHGHAGYGGWAGGYATGGCGCGSSYGYAMTPGMTHGQPGYAYGYAGDPNATQGGTTTTAQPMPGSGTVTGQSTTGTNPQTNPNSSNTNNATPSTGPVTVAGGTTTQAGSGVVQASGTTTVQGGVQPMMGYGMPTTFAAPMYYGSGYANDCYGYDTGASRRRGLFGFRR